MEFFKLDARAPLVFQSRLQRGSIAGAVFFLLFGGVWEGVSLFALRSMIADAGVPLGLTIPFILLFIGVGIAVLTAALVQVAQIFTYRSAFKKITANGLVTSGRIKKCEYRHYSTKHSSGWRHRVYYVYTDDRGNGYTDYYEFRRYKKEEFKPGTEITVLFYNGASLALEEYSILNAQNYADGDIRTPESAAVRNQTVAEGVTQRARETQKYIEKNFGRLLTGEPLKIDPARPVEYAGAPGKVPFILGGILLAFGLAFFSGLFFGIGLPAYMDGILAVGIVMTVIPLLPGGSLAAAGIRLIAGEIKTRKRHKRILKSWTFTLGILYVEYDSKSGEEFVSDSEKTFYCYKNDRGALLHKRVKKPGGAFAAMATASYHSYGMTDLSNAVPEDAEYPLDENCAVHGYTVIACDEKTGESIPIRNATVYKRD